MAAYSAACAWKRAAALYEPSKLYSFDVVISHAGDDPDRSLAHNLATVLMETNWVAWRSRIWPSAHAAPSGKALKEIHTIDALQTTNIAVVLFSNEYFERPACREELKVLMSRYAQHRMQLLPVYLRLTKKQCKPQSSSVLGKGMSLFGTAVHVSSHASAIIHCLQHHFKPVHPCMTCYAARR